MENHADRLLGPDRQLRYVCARAKQLCAGDQRLSKHRRWSTVEDGAQPSPRPRKVAEAGSHFRQRLAVLELAVGTGAIRTRPSAALVRLVERENSGSTPLSVVAGL